MGIYVGVRPGGGGSLAVCALYGAAESGAAAFALSRVAGVDAALGAILGICGEWGGIDGMAVAAPLSWGGAPGGRRPSDAALLAAHPGLAAEVGGRAPTALRGTVALQGPALVWAMAREVAAGTLAEHPVVEATPRLSLLKMHGGAAGRAPGDALLAAARRYRRRPASAGADVAALAAPLLRAAALSWETAAPRDALELDAVVAAVTALAAAHPPPRLQLWRYPAAPIQPVGGRELALLGPR